MTQRWLKSDSQGPTPEWLKNDSTMGSGVTFELLLGHFGVSLLGSLLSHFWVTLTLSVFLRRVLGARQLHKICGGNDTGVLQSPKARVTQRMTFEEKFGCDSDGDPDFPRFYFSSIRLFLLLLAVEFRAIPGPRFWESCGSRFATFVLLRKGVLGRYVAGILYFFSTRV